jgi:hypothetical protein
MRDSPEQRQHWLCEQVLNCFESGWRLPRRSRPVVVAVPLTTAGVRRALLGLAILSVGFSALMIGLSPTFPVVFVALVL